VGDVLRNALRFGVVRWLFRAIRSGGLAPVAVPSVRAIDGPLVLGGMPVAVVATAGHTPGHAAYWFEAAGVLVTGDALISEHPTSRAHGAQLLTSMFHTDPAQAREALAQLSLPGVRRVLPGHGPLIAVDDVADGIAGVLDSARARTR
jgi:glyoxylase-like metal-dependent hydrolase (beta-lactamase superfamily II)